MALLSLGINHLTAPVDIREKVAFAPEQMSKALHELQGIPAINESVIVSTCNRTEIYCDASSDCSEVITHWLTSHHGINDDGLSPYIYQHCDQEVARHLFRVASGLDSMVLGEPQILGQLKTSYDQARNDNTVNSILDRLFQHSFSVAKRVRTDTEIGSNPVSVAFAAVSLSKQIFGKLDHLHALLIGAGETIELVSRHLKSQQIGSMTIANRSAARAQALADQVGADVVQISAVPEQLVRADIVISSTASQLPILGKGATESALKQRKHRPIFMVDLAVPRDIESEVGDLQDIYLYTVDDLKTVVDENLRGRELAAEAAQEIINLEVTAFNRWLKTHQSSDQIRQLRDSAELIKQQAIEKALAQLKNDSDPQQTLERLANEITNKLLHKPTIEMRKALQNEDEERIRLLKSLISPDS
ncbi:MAG: glutamyl-tRNA reductase [Gammaproteobacteria bacterium]|nr:glutamyl-tRNA reductase [Gammaproteobacteria bacterium]MDH3534861.1 glutamyl-tRNA reductase [Gammaproteobacteria bacterium]